MKLAALLSLVLASVATLGAVPAPVSNLSGLPLFFQPGNTPPGGPAQFLARGTDYEFLVSPTEVRFVLSRFEPAAQNAVSGPDVRTAPVRASVLRAARMEFVGANSHASLGGEQPLSGKINYLIGNDPAQWRTGLSSFAKLRAESIYPGITASFYGNQDQLEYDLVVAPHADPAAIVLRFEGLDRLVLDPEGDLLLTLGGGQLRQPRPVVYQIVHGARQSIAGGYRLQDARTVTFALGDYNRDLPLIIDPIFSYATYFGGNRDDAAYSVKVDTNGCVYIAGATLSTQFLFSIPTNAYQGSFKGGSSTGDAFVAKLNSTGSALIYYTYLGGTNNDAAYDLALDSAGNAYIAGFTASPDFPTRNALFPAIGGSPDPFLHAYPNDGFVAEINTNGSALVFSTFLGGEGNDVAGGIAVDPAGNIYVTGYTASTNFPFLGGFQNYGGNNDAFVTKLAPRGTRLIYSTFLGGTANDAGEGIAADETGAAYVTGFTISTNFPMRSAYQGFLSGGYDAFVTKLSAFGGIVYSTYLGGTNDDFGYRIAVDPLHNAYITGAALSENFPHRAAVPGLAIGNNGTNSVNFDAFLSRFSSNGGLVSSVLFGGSGTDSGWDVAIDAGGQAFVIGTTLSFDFPVTNAIFPFHTNYYGGKDVFVTALATNATAALYSGYLGGFNDDFGYGIALDAESSAYITGLTVSTNFPTASAYQPNLRGLENAFIAKIRLQAPALAASRAGANLLLQWPVTASDYLLESATDLSPPISWAVVPQPPLLSQGVYTVTLGLTNTFDALRLHRP